MWSRVRLRPDCTPRYYSYRQLSAFQEPIPSALYETQDKAGKERLILLNPFLTELTLIHSNALALVLSPTLQTDLVNLPGEHHCQGEQLLCKYARFCCATLEAGSVQEKGFVCDVLGAFPLPPDRAT